MKRSVWHDESSGLGERRSKEWIFTLSLLEGLSVEILMDSRALVNSSPLSSRPRLSLKSMPSRSCCSSTGERAPAISTWLVAETDSASLLVDVAMDEEGSCEYRGRRGDEG